MDENSITRLHVIRVLSFAIPITFLLSLLILFILNDKAYYQLGLLTPFQFNITGMRFQFIPAVFSYFLVGVLIIIQWILLAVMLRKMRIAAYLFSLSGFILIFLGLFPVSDQNCFLSFYISIAFVLINFVGLFVMLFNVNEMKNKYILLLLLGFMSYKLFNKFILFNDEFNVNYLVVACFLWYPYSLKMIQLNPVNKRVTNLQNLK